MDQCRQFSTFFLDDLLFGVAVESVQEIAGAIPMTPVPLAPKKIRGLINLRGQIITAIDLRRCLGLPEQPSGTPSVNVILHADNACASLLVDRVGEIVEVEESSFELPPETLRGPARELLQGAYKLRDSLMHVLDLEQTLRPLRGIQT